MAFDSEVAILGTGLAPLVAANYLMSQGRSVLLLNLDWDFFLEDSELPFNPFLQQLPVPESLELNSPEKALNELRPNFPGAIEFWSQATRIGQKRPSGEFHDLEAPHVRQRGRIWISTPDKDRIWSWEQLEDLYVGASDAGLNPQILDGVLATRWFPGFSGHTGAVKALYLPKLYDVDTVRYRNGLLEFIRERLNPEKRVVCAVSELEPMPGGIRFRARGESYTAQLSDGMLVFWTPRLSKWVLNTLKKFEISLPHPTGIRIWEQWLLNSRESLNPETIGIFGDLAVWADFEGVPPEKIHRLAVLRSGPLIPISPPILPRKQLNLPFGGLGWASSDSMSSLYALCQGFLKWDRFSVRSLKAKAIFEWPNPLEPNPKSISGERKESNIYIVPGCDGPTVDIVRNTRAACDQLLPESRS